MSHPLKFAPLSLDVSHSIIVVDYESFKIKAQIRVFIIIWITFLVQMDNNKFPYMFDSSEIQLDQLIELLFALELI